MKPIRGMPSFRFARLGHWQLVICVWAGIGTLLAVRLWLLPAWIEASASGRTPVANAIESAAIMTGALVLAGIGAALLGCDFHNRLQYHRKCRGQRGQCEVEFLTSLGHSVTKTNSTSNCHLQD